MTERVIDGVTYAQGWDQENRLVWVSTGGVTTTFTYDANGALVKKEDPAVGTTYYVGPHYEVLVPAVILPPAPTDLEACRESGSPPNVCNYLSWTGSAGVTYNVYRSSTSPVPIDAGHLVTSGITETNYTDCGNVYNRYYAVTAANENGESDPSNEDRASESCGSAMAMTLPVLNAAALTESGGDPVVTKYFFFSGKRVAMDREGVLQYLATDHLGSTSLVMDDQGSVVAESRHYPYGEERWRWPQEGTFPTEYRFTGQRSHAYIKLTIMGARWYDAYINHFISPDTIIPQPGNPQSLNRYSYCLNNPLKFVDPSGHVEEDQVDRALTIISILAAYGVLIERDFFWLPVMHPAPGESPSVWNKGAWELSTMEAVLQGVHDIATAMGGQESFKQAFSHGLRFERRSVSKFTPLAGAETLHREITIFDRGVDLQDFAGLRSTIAHELAHAWDQESGGELSEGLVRITGGRTVRNGFWIGDFRVWGTEVYVPGSPPAPAAVGRSRGEDWAYSVEAWVYGNRTPQSALTVDRQFYLRNRFPGIMGPQRGAR